MGSLRRLRAVAKKETREILRDPITLGIAIVLPLVMMFLFAYALTLDVKEVRLAVLDEDLSAESREYVASFLRSGYFRLHAAVRSPREVEGLLDRGAVRVALVIPAGFSRTLGQGLPAEVQTLLDGSFANTAVIALNYVDAVTQAYTARLQERSLAARLGGVPRPSTAIRVESRVRYNPGLRSEHYIVPGLFAVILMAFPPLLTALAVVRERERGSILQIYTSPIRAWEFLGGKLVPYAGVAFLEMLLLLGAGRFWFSAPVRGSLALLLGLSLLYVATTVGIGLLISTLTRSQVVAILLAIVLTLMPALLFSGFLFTIESMPRPIQLLSLLSPLRYYLEIGLGIFVKGVGMDVLWREALAMGALGLGIFALGLWRFGTRLG